jgi:hypothetical protein
MKYNGLYFHQLFHRYYTEVCPAKLVLVSFLEPNAQGQMSQALEQLGIRPVLQFRLAAARPDLSKLDDCLAQLATKTATFEAQLEKDVAAAAAAATAASPAAATATAATKSSKIPAAESRPS